MSYRNLCSFAVQEECRGWDINEAVFSPGVWEMYQPMLRADFRLFDEYVPSNTTAEAQAAPMASQLRMFWGTQDRRVTEAMVQVSSRAAGGRPFACRLQHSGGCCGCCCKRPAVLLPELGGCCL